MVPVVLSTCVTRAPLGLEELETSISNLDFFQDNIILVDFNIDLIKKSQSTAIQIW